MIEERLAFARLVLELAELVGSEIARAERQRDRCSELAGYVVSERRDANLDTLLAVLDARRTRPGRASTARAPLGAGCVVGVIRGCSSKR